MRQDRSSFDVTATTTADSNQSALTVTVAVPRFTTAAATTIFVQSNATSSSAFSSPTSSGTDCPSSNGTIFTAQANLTGNPAPAGITFRKYCDTHLVSNNNINFIALDNFDNYITACAQVNIYGLNSVNCTGVSFTPNASRCWLHAGPEPIGVGDAQGEDSAVLV
ncbi:MAG: hypothetical protein MMC33_004057 [Icmadophila ericetorum]|nr:hypothetical protein [Icmadophila ericetorum]